jgi:capsular polysaccharide biosynthesis protein
MVALGAFADRTWVVQERDQYVRADRVIVATPQLTHRARAEYLLRQVEPTIGPPDPGANHRVFLIRRPPSRRFISNVGEVAEALRARGFRMVDAAEMSMRDQIELFRGTRHLVAIHGAGLTNLLWRAGQPMTVYELCTLPHRYSDDFLTMARELDFEFHRLEFENAPGCDPDVPDILVDLDTLLPVVDAALAREAEQQVEPEG